jgi:hypothetical protein
MVSTGTYLEWRMPASWVQAPTPDEARFAEWVAELLSSCAGDERPLRLDLERFAAVVSEQDAASDDRGWILALTPAGMGDTRVLAVGWMHLLPETDLSVLADALRESAGAPPPGLLSRVVDRRPVQGRDTVVGVAIVSDAPTDDGPRRYKRFAGYTHDAALGAVLRLEISTSDVTAFEDMGATCAKVLGSARGRPLQEDV